MEIFEKHEQFEIEVLDKLKSTHLLQPLVFGGGTMLRLCHDLDRYSVDLDFWFIKPVNSEEYFEKTKTVLKKDYELTDAQIKFYTLLFEIKSSNYPRRLKIEIRKEIKDVDFQEKIAYSKFSNIQVLLRTHTLHQAMKNKINALQERNEIRDAFDIEFLIRKGIEIPGLDTDKKSKIIDKIDSFSANDFKVKLGSIVNADKRNSYIQNRFNFLKEKLII
jgi:hypothetical protein